MTDNRTWLCVVVRMLMVSVAGMAMAATASAQAEFPYDRELLLDASPIKGVKRIPSIEVSADGRAQVFLWCKDLDAQVIIVNDTITVLLGAARDNSCTPEREQRDRELAAALSEVTNWRREGNTLLLTGPQTVRFQMPSN